MGGPVGVRDRVVKLRAVRPDWSLSELGLAVGVSRQRVSQILQSEGLATRRVRQPSAAGVEALSAAEAIERAAYGVEAAAAVRRSYLQALGLADA